MSIGSIVDGVFAIYKPQSLSSAQVVRDVQAAFTRSNLFSPSLAVERADRARLSTFQKRRRKDKSLKVKVGHGGTLDPLATGVLIIGVGKGTKSLQQFLSCTKTYDVDLLFGAATDTYDILGKVLNTAPYAHVTKDKVEKKLEQFRGTIMQQPPIYSALRVQGKHLYEFAREGREVPIEIQARPVTVHSLQITKWLEEHEYEWPKGQVDAEERDTAERVLNFGETSICAQKVASDLTTRSIDNPPSNDAFKRKRSTGASERENDVHHPPARRPKREVNSFSVVEEGHEESISTDNSCQSTTVLHTSPFLAVSKPPVVSLRMSVSSGFYVRSLCHDLGKAIGSLGLMAKLVRIRQGDFELEQNVLDYDKIGLGEELWRPEIDKMLYDWSQNQAAPSSPNGEHVENRVL